MKAKNLIWSLALTTAASLCSIGCHSKAAEVVDYDAVARMGDQGASPGSRDMAKELDRVLGIIDQNSDENKIFRIDGGKYVFDKETIEALKMLGGEKIAFEGHFKSQDKVAATPRIVEIATMDGRSLGTVFAFYKDNSDIFSEILGSGDGGKDPFVGQRRASIATLGNFGDESAEELFNAAEAAAKFSLKNPSETGCLVRLKSGTYVARVQGLAGASNPKQQAQGYKALSPAI
jgi:hypothetical protein